MLQRPPWLCTRAVERASVPQSCESRNFHVVKTGRRSRTPWEAPRGCPIPQKHGHGGEILRDVGKSTAHSIPAINLLSQNYLKNGRKLF